MMQVAVFGAAGFIGRNLVTELIKRGYMVKCFDSVETKDFENFALTDISNFAIVEKALHGVAVLPKNLTRVSAGPRCRARP